MLYSFLFLDSILIILFRSVLHWRPSSRTEKPVVRSLQWAGDVGHFAELAGSAGRNASYLSSPDHKLQYDLVLAASWRLRGRAISRLARKGVRIGWPCDRNTPCRQDSSGSSANMKPACSGRSALSTAFIVVNSCDPQQVPPWPGWRMLSTHNICRRQTNLMSILQPFLNWTGVTISTMISFRLVHQLGRQSLPSTKHSCAMKVVELQLWSCKTIKYIRRRQM